MRQHKSLMRPGVTPNFVLKFPAKSLSTSHEISHRTLDSSVDTAKSPSPKRQLIAAHLDLTSLRWQMIFGFLLVCLVSYISDQLRPSTFIPADCASVGWASAVPPVQDILQLGQTCRCEMPTSDPFTLASLVLDSWLYQDNFGGYLFTNYLLRALVSLFIALVMLELTGLTGNRGGCAAAIWSALLFAVSPNTAASLFCVSARPFLFGALFLLSSIFFALRFRLSEEKWYVYLSLATLVFFLGSITLALSQLSVDPANQPPFLQNLTPGNAVLEASGIVSGDMSQLIVRVALACSLLIFLARLAKGWPARQTLVAAFCLAVATVLPAFCAPDAAPVLALYAAISLSMLLPLLALPVTDKADEKDSRPLATLGMLTLIAIFLSWCAIFEDQSTTITKMAQPVIYNKAPNL